MKNLLFTLGLCSVFLFSAVSGFAQTKETKQEKKELREEKKEQREKKDKMEAAKQAQKNVANIETLNFSFYPTTYEPEFGVTNDLSGMGDFYFTVDKSTFYLNLPYISRFYSGINPPQPMDNPVPMNPDPMNPGNAPINLTCNQFLYAVHSTDGINIQVTIIPADNDVVRWFNEGIRFVFNMNKNTGYAKLVVSAPNRQEMTYTGTFN